MPKLKINGTEIEVAPGTSIIQASEMLGYEVPRFCYHDKLSVPANCRMCLVEVKGAPKPVASCAMACGENMEVLTESPMVKRARQGVMEMLLINHPLDCPICDQGGECDLQDQAMGYGYDRSRYHENKRAVKDKQFGPLVKTTLTRCIQCTRCIRFGEEIAGVPELGLLNRGEDVEIGTFVEKVISSELSGNLIDVCPVGALTSKPYAYKARPWELRKTETIDVLDAVGSNIRVDAAGNEVMRVLPRLNEDVNEEWINDRTRFAYDGLKRQRLDRPYVRDAATGRLRPSTWDEAFATIAARLKQTPANRIGALAGDLCDSESMFALKNLMHALGATALECRIDGAQYDVANRAAYTFNSGIAAIEQADAILLVGTNPRWEATLVNARIRKAWLAKRIKIGLIGEQRDMTYPVTYIGAGADSVQSLIDGQHSFADTLKNAKNPMVIIGQGVFQREDGAAQQALMHSLAEKFALNREGWNGFNVLQTAAARVGALDIGFTGPLSLAEVKNLDVVYLLGADVDGISQNSFVIYQGHHGDIGASRADVILPGAAYTEKEGLYVNTEGRVQMGKRAVFPPGEAREDWKILRALSEHLGRVLPYDNLHQLRQALIKAHPHFGQIDRLFAHEWGAFGKAGAISKAPYQSPVKNFYMADVISRASLTMAKCEEVFIRHNTIPEAAE